MNIIDPTSTTDTPKEVYLPLSVQQTHVTIERDGGTRERTIAVVDWDGTPWDQSSDHVWNPNAQDGDGKWESGYFESDNGALVDDAETEVMRAFQALEGLRAIYFEMNLGDEMTAGDFSAADQCEALYELMGRLGYEVA